MSTSAIPPKFISIEIPESYAINRAVSPVDIFRPGSVKLEQMMESANHSDMTEIPLDSIQRTEEEDPFLVKWFQAKPTINRWSGIDKQVYEESVLYMKEVIYAPTNEQALRKFTELKGKLIPPHFTIALSYLKIRGLV